MQLKDLEGKHLFSGIDNIMQEDKDGYAFIIDGETYECYCDPDDGSRSYLTSLMPSDYKIKNLFSEQEVYIIHSTKGDYSNNADILYFYDTTTNKVVLEIGTDYSELDYPVCIMRWHPENLAINRTVYPVAFKYSVIGKNTIENRQWLNKLGFKPDYSIDALMDDLDFDLPSDLITDCNLELLIVNHGTLDKGYYGGLDRSEFEGKKRFYSNVINCIDNDALFRAVSAMRDDSDYMQWYYSSYWDEKEWCLSDRHVVKKSDCIINHERVWHKATLAELQEHFKK